MADKAIIIKDLTFKYDEDLPVILDNISATFNYHSISLITGYSGCGKSTILYLISKIIPHVTNGVISGNILVNNTDISNLDIGNVSRQVGVVVQNPDLQIINNIVEDEIAFGCENIGLSKAEILTATKFYSELMQLNLQDKTKNLSGGEKERLILASVLAMKQKILLLDEPLANLDQQSIKIVVDNLVKLRDEGYCIVLAEHRLTYLLDIIDKCYVLENKVLKETSTYNYFKSLTSNIYYENLTTSDKELLVINNVGHKFNKKCVLNNVSFRVNKGDNILVLGDNGCGKTTLLKIIGRLLKPKGGKVIQLFDPKIKTTFRSSKRWFRQIGYIFQNPNYQLFMPSVIQELNYGASDREYVDYLIKELNLTPLLKLHPQALSEGQKRRLTVASVLASKPKILLLDEPTVGQDNKNLDCLIGVLLDYQKRFNATIISVSHDYRYAYSMSSKVVIIEKNKETLVGGRELLNKYFKIKETE